MVVVDIVIWCCDMVLLCGDCKLLCGSACVGYTLSNAVLMLQRGWLLLAGLHFLVSCYPGVNPYR